LSPTPRAAAERRVRRTADRRGGDGGGALTGAAGRALSQLLAHAQLGLAERAVGVGHRLDQRRGRVAAGLLGLELAR